MHNPTISRRALLRYAVKTNWIVLVCNESLCSISFVGANARGVRARIQ